MYFSATYFMTYQTILKTSADYIGALRYARELADNITLTLNHWNADNITEDRVAAGTKWANITEKVFPYR